MGDIFGALNQGQKYVNVQGLLACESIGTCTYIVGCQGARGSCDSRSQ